MKSRSEVGLGELYTEQYWDRVGVSQEDRGESNFSCLNRVVGSLLLFDNHPSGAFLQLALTKPHFACELP